MVIRTANRTSKLPNDEYWLILLVTIITQSMSYYYKHYSETISSQQHLILRLEANKRNALILSANDCMWQLFSVHQKLA